MRTLLLHVQFFITIFLISVYISIDGRCLRDQQSLLLHFKQNLTFDPVVSHKLVTWNSSSDCCSWDGVTCDNYGRVVGLDLAYEYISAGIDNDSSSLYSLQYLQTLDLSFNNFSSPIAESFAKFSNLTSLSLISSGFRGKFPKKIIELHTMKNLDLSGNDQLHGSLPEMFHQNASLQTLVLSDTSFSGKIPGSVANLKMLSTLDLGGCSFSGTIPNSIANLTNLDYLDLSLNNFTGPIPSFSLMKNVTNIDLSSNSLTGSISSTDWRVLSSLVTLYLNNNSLSGQIPSSIFSISSLVAISLSHNHFTGQFNEFPKPSNSQLGTLDLSSNKLEGPIPTSIFGFHNLDSLTLSFNNFSGMFPLSELQPFRYLSDLDLSYNNLSINATINNGHKYSSFPELQQLRLASCNLKKFPDFFKNQSRLTTLDLSDNQIHGEIPNWIWSIHLEVLNLSCNFFTRIVEPSQGFPSSVSIVDLHANQLQGQISILPPFTIFLDYSSNNFSSVMPANIGDYLDVSGFIFLSNNNLYGRIPESICNKHYPLQVLDLSNNSLSGMIPKCLIEKSATLVVLNLRGNKLSGTISDNFSSSCALQTLDLCGNLLEGKVPKSLVNCKKLEVLNLGNNQLNDMFPSFLINIPRLHVLVLRSNKFFGPITCPNNNASWAMLQIADIALNNFGGELPQTCFKTWTTMVDSKVQAPGHLRFDSFVAHYQDSVTVSMKGQELKLEKILTIFTSIDFSSNNFHGSIPKVVGELKALYILNLSHNALTGQIPSSFGNLQQLESLDLSRNNLSGLIPSELASLTFLSSANFSYNQLVGKIPTGTQLQSFSNTSYIGNAGLCGLPLEIKCSSTNEAPPAGSDESHSNKIEWNWISAEVGFIFGFGMVAGPLFFCRRWRIRYYRNLDRVLWRFLPSLLD